MWNVIRTLVGVISGIAMTVIAYLTYVNTVEDQARRKTTTVEVSAADGQPATATVTVTATRPTSQTPHAPRRAATPEQDTPREEPATPSDAPPAEPSDAPPAEPVGAPLFAHRWHLPLSGREVVLEPVTHRHNAPTMFVVRDITGPVPQPIGYGTVDGRNVRMQLRITKEAAPGEYVTRDATLRLTLSRSGDQLTGHFRGAAPEERGRVLWLAAGMGLGTGAQHP